MKKFAFFVLSAFCPAWFSALPCAAQNDLKAPENDKFRVVGYVPGYRDVDQIPDRTIEKLDVACYAFATIDSTGAPVVANRKQLKKFARRAHKLGVDVMISFNGKHAVFTRVMADAQKRREMCIRDRPSTPVRQYPGSVQLLLP